MTWETDTHTGVDNHPPIRRGEGKPCERGGERNWGKPDKKDIKKEETKQKTMS
jgi:hypothetical protein